MVTPNYAQLQKVKGVGTKRYIDILAKLNQTGQTLDDLFKMPASEIASVFNLPKNVAEAISASNLQSNSQPNEFSQLEAKGIKTLKHGAEDYPKRLDIVLGSNSPSTLYAWGNLDLLNKPAVGFCGSRNVTDKGIEITVDTAKQITDQGWVVVSGHARGVDTAAHRTALEGGGSTIIVAAEGILTFKLRLELKKIAKPEQILIISEFEPNSKWTIGRAMMRNKTIIALSDAMMLVEARSEGGTFEAGKTALKLKMPLYVVNFESPGTSAAGNQYFLKRGAIPLGKNPDTGRANIANLRSAVQAKITSQQENITPNKPEQLPLIPL